MFPTIREPLVLHIIINFAPQLAAGVGSCGASFVM